MKNNVSVQPWRNASVFVGPLDVTYTYDNLYQLKSLTGKYRPHVAYGYQYSDAFQYDEIGNIKRKAQSHDRLVWDNQTVDPFDVDPVTTQLAGSRFDHNEVGLTYTLDYQYTGPRPHATNAIIGDAAKPEPGDASSTPTTPMATTGETPSGTEPACQTWDEENRLKEVTRNGGSLAKFRYDDSGERTKKRTAAGDSWYVNQFFVLLPNNRPTKHIFVGDTRIATKTDAISMQTPVLHYYHSDHLGTTSYVSDKDQNLVQHERYFAFGELWRPGGPQEEGDAGGNRREWLFTGKEWDVDTGLYYFGARYFDPHTDVWQSTDPILASYMRGGPSEASEPRTLASTRTRGTTRSSIGILTGRASTCGVVRRGLLCEPPVGACATAPAPSPSFRCFIQGYRMGQSRAEHGMILISLIGDMTHPAPRGDRSRPSAGTDEADAGTGGDSF